MSRTTKNTAGNQHLIWIRYSNSEYSQTNQIRCQSGTGICLKKYAWQNKCRLKWLSWTGINKNEFIRFEMPMVSVLQQIPVGYKNEFSHIWNAYGICIATNASWFTEMNFIISDAHYMRTSGLLFLKSNEQTTLEFKRSSNRVFFTFILHEQLLCLGHKYWFSSRTSVKFLFGTLQNSPVDAT